MRILIGVTIMLLMGGCTTHRFQTWKKGSQWSLVRVEIDKSLLANRGNLSVFQPPSEESFGRAPQAQGTLGVTEDGRVVCRVDFIERGPQAAYSYNAVRFDGFFGKSPERITPVRAPAPNVPLGTTTVLHVRELSTGHLRVQGATGERMLPYVYYFAPPPARAVLLPLPTVRQ